MGLLKHLFKTTEKKEEKLLPWIALNDPDQLNTIENQSGSRTQFIFKHSTRCGISRMVMNQFIESYDLTKSEADLYYLDLLSHRKVSDEVGHRFQVMHQSPQLLIIRNGHVVNHASHGAINAMDLDKMV